MVSLDHAADAIALQACQIINIKPGRVGGYLEAVRIHDLADCCMGWRSWCGMVETGLVGPPTQHWPRYRNFNFAGDVSGSDRFFAEDITEPIVMHDGYVDVPKGPGLVWPPLRSNGSTSERTLTSASLSIPTAGRRDVDAMTSRLASSALVHPERVQPRASLDVDAMTSRLASSALVPSERAAASFVERRSSSFALSHPASLELRNSCLTSLFITR